MALQSTVRILRSFFLFSGLSVCLTVAGKQTSVVRERLSINDDWTFFKYASAEQADSLIYDVRPVVTDKKDDKAADSKPTEAVRVDTKRFVLKSWILPTGNDFIKDPTKRYTKVSGNPGADFPLVQASFDDRSWEHVNLPHDWAIKGPFQTGWNSEVGGGMGRLPSPGVAWYRKKLNIPASDAGKTLFLEVDGAMSYAMVWINGHLVGGWPYGYTSFQVDLTPFIKPGGVNQLAIRIDNPNNSSRWYPGGGIYRNVWLTKIGSIRVSHWGTRVETRNVTERSATIDLEVSVDNFSRKKTEVQIKTQLFLADSTGKKIGNVVAAFDVLKTNVKAGAKALVHGSLNLDNPRLWGPVPSQKPNLYIAVTTLLQKGRLIDQYETPFGIRSVVCDPLKGVLINGQSVYIQGVNQHHDLGALGAAFNVRAAERQLELLRELGCNAIRMAHNPPAPELLELTDRMGFLVVDEIFDGWERKKSPLDFHLVFPEWGEQDLRAMIRRDRNHPSVFQWSYGNEVGEQYTDSAGAAVSKKLYTIVKEEDTTRTATASMNYAKPNMPFPEVLDVISLNYQGEGIRDTPAHAHLQGIRTPPLYPAFHEKFPNKLILSTENAATISTRGTYLFPVANSSSSPVKDGMGGDSKKQQVSAYELYAVDFGSSPDKVFATMEKHPYVGGGFVWSGWDYLGEPTPYYLARSSYFGIIDLAGFKKDRFFLYQSKWRPDFPMAHILPHWNWPERVGENTPVHVFTSGDEAELFLNGRSLGRKTKGPEDARLRWDSVLYEPGELKVIAYKKGIRWAEDVVKTTGPSIGLDASADHSVIGFDGEDLAFVTIRVIDKEGLTVPTANLPIRFSVEGPGEIVGTDNGDPSNMVSFASAEHDSFNGLCLVIVRGISGKTGEFRLRAESPSLKDVSIKIQNKTL